jgi:citrate synthase
MEPWRTAIVNADETHIWLRGFDVTALMRDHGFVETIFLLHRGRLPAPGERKLLDAMLVGVADHGAGAPSCAAARLVASGNRQSVAAAVGAGVLAIGDEHGAAAGSCMKLIARELEAASRSGESIDAVAARAVDEAREHRARLPGLGHRVHTTDPRVAVLFDLATEAGVAADGVRFMRALERAAAARIKPLPLNIDGALAAILHDLGFPPQAGALIFIIGRVAGITAEVAEEYARERAMRIHIPVEYDGDPPRPAPRPSED